MDKELLESKLKTIYSDLQQKFSECAMPQLLYTSYIVNELRNSGFVSENPTDEDIDFYSTIILGLHNKLNLSSKKTFQTDYYVSKKTPLSSKIKDEIQKYSSFVKSAINEITEKFKPEVVKEDLRDYVMKYVFKELEGLDNQRHISVYASIYTGISNRKDNITILERPYNDVDIVKNLIDKL